MTWTLFILGLLLFPACSETEGGEVSDPASVALNFQGYFDHSPLLMYERAYDYEADMRLKFQLFHFYISDVTLIREGAVGGEGPQLLEVDLVSFENVLDENAAREGYTILAEDIPPGTYQGIKLGLGLTNELNATQPGDYTPGHPLTDNYWSWAMGYVFFKVEGNADIDGDGQFSEKLTFHIGLEDQYRELVFNRPIEVRSGQTLALDFEVDLHRVLSDGNGNFVDFRKVTQDHTNDMALAAAMADNLQAAITLEQD